MSAPPRIRPGRIRRAAIAAGAHPSAVHPVYRVLAEDSAAAGDTADAGGRAGDAAPGPGLDADLDHDAALLVLRHATTPALLTLAVDEGAGPRTLRVGLHPDGATVEAADPQGTDPGAQATDADARATDAEAQASGTPSTSAITEVHLADLPARLADALPAGPLSAPPLLTQESAARSMRLAPEQARAIIDAIREGRSPAEAARELEGIEPALLSALTAAGPRVSLSLTLHPDARGDAARPDGVPRSDRPREDAPPVTFARVWTQHGDALLRTDASGAPPGSIQEVAPGDVLGTLLPLLDQGVRFSAGDSAGEAMTR
ncbi:hypothetical protein [Brachybacterium nesterenkovii]|uniref:Uncharacterized protein n=1 Tax=Brachybacterium nesterenkovii TaxID=47847 RepID=A0A1X6WSR0_9MICO|nr:hypothetical protein [Brachybacterium nesterenkovii]SLM87830.1 hypothetical protein FM110_00425 [Brachybacterium nesterenkovii]